jgi:hypothetical protein
LVVINWDETTLAARIKIHLHSDSTSFHSGCPGQNRVLNAIGWPNGFTLAHPDQSGDVPGDNTAALSTLFQSSPARAGFPERVLGALLCFVVPFAVN